MDDDSLDLDNSLRQQIDELKEQFGKSAYEYAYHLFNLWGGSEGVIRFHLKAECEHDKVIVDEYQLFNIDIKSFKEGK